MPIIDTVWIIGSYNRNAATTSQSVYCERLTRLLASGLANAQVPVVAGESDLLVDLCNAYRGSSQPDSYSRAIMIHGSLRHPDPKSIFERFLARVPAAALVIGGGDHGRTAQEAAAAHSLGLPLGGYTQTGGVSAGDPNTGIGFSALWAQQDPSDAAFESIKWLRGHLTNVP